MRPKYSKSSAVPTGAVEVDGATLEYPLYNNIVLDRLRALVSPLFPRLSPAVKRAVNDVTFSVKPGELVGLVGVNGAGKTSLLKLISGLVTPTSGRIAVGGRVLALLAMGVGFRPNLTGRENLMYSGLLFGLRPREVEEILPAVIEFSELGPALDQPYFTYSSGMRARLAFSLATHVPADVIILDETLATGDARFVAKCYKRIKALHTSGATILFVSHNLGEVSRLCDRVLVLSRGVLLFDGEAREGLRKFEHDLISDAASSTTSAMRQAGLQVSVDVLNGAGEPVDQVTIGEPATVRMTLDSDEYLGRCFPYLRLVREDTDAFVTFLIPNRWAIVTTSDKELDNVEVPKGRTKLTWETDEWPLGEGLYRLDAHVAGAVTWRELKTHEGQSWFNIKTFYTGYRNLHMKNNNSLLELASSFQCSSSSGELNQAEAEHG